MIGLVACCKTKLDRAAPARALYTSPLFRKSLAYAEALCELVYVMSAEHGLVELDAVLAPYDRTLAKMTARERATCGAVIALQLLVDHGSTFDLLVLAGAPYVEPIRAAFVHAGAHVTIREPLAGLEIGQRLSFLSKPAALPVSPNPLAARELT